MKQFIYNLSRGGVVCGEYTTQEALTWQENTSRCPT